MPKVIFFSDPSNGRPGLGATIQLDSGEPCVMSIAPGWVRVKKSRTGLFGRTLYNVRDVHKTTETARALTYLYPDSRLPPGFTDRTLCAFANAILHCDTCNAVATVLNEAVTRAGAQAERDVEIVSDFGSLYRSGRSPHWLNDLAVADFMLALTGGWPLWALLTRHDVCCFSSSLSPS